MSGLNIKDFLTAGAFLQIGPDLFKVLVGPFKAQDISSLSILKHNVLLYKPNFWDFLNQSLNFPQKTVYTGTEAFILDREEFIGLLSSEKPEKPNLVWDQPDEDLFKDQFEWSQKNFLAQKLVKTVPVIRQKAQTYFSEENIAWCLLNLLNNRNFGWSYAFIEKGCGMLGHTPEVLTQWTQLDRQLQTVALAGTCANEPGAYEKISTDTKIRHEHEIVVDDIVEKLNRLNLKSKCIQGETDILELKYLLHLMTEFQIEVANRETVLQIIDTLHPTAAMGIYPASELKHEEFFDFNLQKERQSFAAPFAFIEKEAIYCVVAIRNILFSPESLQIYSGCGVTSDSVYQEELLELENKRDSVKKMLGLDL